MSSNHLQRLSERNANICQLKLLPNRNERNAKTANKSEQKDTNIDSPQFTCTQMHQCVFFCCFVEWLIAYESTTNTHCQCHQVCAILLSFFSLFFPLPRVNGRYLFSSLSLCVCVCLAFGLCVSSLQLSFFFFMSNLNIYRLSRSCCAR